MPFGIAAGHIATASAANEILSAGGNAVDASIAAYLTSFVAEPCMASAGGGGLALISMDNKQPVVLDFFCQTPRVKNKLNELDFYPVEVDFGTATETFYIGLASMGVPGAIAGVFKMHELFGSMPLKELFEPAIQACREGVEVDEFQHLDYKLLRNIFNQSPRGRELFFNEDGEVKQVGEILKMPNLADLLDVLRHEGKDLFYKGEIGKRIVDQCKNKGGLLSTEDFNSYSAEIRKPIHFKFSNHHLFCASFPSFGGVILATFLKRIEAELHQYPPLSNAHFAQLIRQIRWLDRMKTQPLKLLEYLEQEQNVKVPGALGFTQKWGGTTHFNVLDNKGNAVSLSTSIGEGCGYFIEGTDTQMNNMLGETALLPHGLHSWQKNARLMSMMTPTMVLNEGMAPEISLGSGGAGRIPFVIGQVLINLLHFKLDLEKSVDLSRVHYADKTIHFEAGYDLKGFKPEKEDRKLVWDAKSLFFGGVHTVSNLKGNIQAEGDSRRFGVSKTSP